jgi:serine/threonine-protein phosphatase 2A regulatory subunit B'
VVGSPDSQNDRGAHVSSPDRTSLGMDLGGLGGGGGGATPPRAGTFTSRLRTGPKDTIPIVGKPPRKQRSSRFVVTEKVEIERLPPFLGE